MFKLINGFFLSRKLYIAYRTVNYVFVAAFGITIGSDVVKVDMDRNLILVKGAIPGPKGGIVTIKNTVKA